jgi:hypothetical protein
VDVVEAINVMARWMLRSGFERLAEDGHENLPDVGAYDYETIEKIAESMLPADASIGEYEAALAVLEARAEAATDAWPDPPKGDDE